MENPLLIHADSRSSHNGLSLEFRVRAISPLPMKIFIQLWLNVHLNVRMCITHKSAVPTQGQVTTEGHEFEPALNSVSASYLLYPWKDFH